MSDSTSDDTRGGRGRRRASPPTATQRALGLLVRREHSRRELRQKLTARGHERDEAEAAVDRLAQAGWQDDARFAESLVRSRVGAGYGPLRIRAELAAHGVDREVAAAALQAQEYDWAALAHELVRRRFGRVAPADPGTRRKAAELLLRRGFPRELAWHAAGLGGGPDPDGEG